MNPDRHCAFQTPSCPQRGIAQTQHKLNRSRLCLEASVTQRTAALPFLQEFCLADYRSERTGSCGTSSHQVYAEEVHRPCYSWEDETLASWNWPSDSPHASCTREIRRKCGCVQRWCYPEHPFNGSHTPPQLKVKGQQYYREVLYVSDLNYKGHNKAGNTEQQEPQWDNLANSNKPAYNGQYQRRRVSFKNLEEQHGFDSAENSRLTSPYKPHCNGPNSAQTAFFPTEVPQSKTEGLTLHEPTLKVNELGWNIRRSQGAKRLENHDNQRKSQRTVREQIKRVVSELEEVLGGLKQVQLEMKEVVQQIDVLTSNIDFGEEEPTSSSSFLQEGRCQSCQTDAVTQNSSGDQQVSPKSQSDTPPKTSHSCPAHSLLTLDSVHINSPPVLRTNTHSSPPDLRSVTAENNCSTVTQSSEPHRMRSNGSYLPDRPPKSKANGLQHPKAELEYNNKSQRAPPYTQNGQVKTRTCPGKQKTLCSTVG